MNRFDIPIYINNEYHLKDDFISHEFDNYYTRYIVERRINMRIFLKFGIELIKT